MKGIQPHLRIKPGQVNKYCIIVGHPLRAEKIAGMLTSSKKISDNRGYQVYNGKYSGIPITICNTGIGGPSAGIAIEELINCGVKVIIRIGSGGVMKKEINTGDIVISTGVCKEEKSTQEYVPPEFAAVPNYDVLNALIQSAKESKKRFFYGVTMCCDGFYAKKHHNLQIEWGKLNVIGSDMESSMLFTLSQIRKIKAGFIFYAGLNVSKKEKTSDIIKQEEMRNAGEKNAIMIAFNAIKKLKEAEKNGKKEIKENLQKIS